MIPMTLPRGLLASVAMLVAIVASVRFVDLPLARALAEAHLAHAWLTGDTVKLPVLVVLAYVALLVGAAHLVARRPLPLWAVAGMLAGLALVLSLALVEDVLKPIFGRTVPSVMLRAGHGGFHWFHSGGALQSFPSGHTDQAAAIVAVLWQFYPRGRWLYVAALAVLALALMLGEWHFLGDILAGGFVGTWAGVLVTQVWALVGNALTRRGAITAPASAPPPGGS